MYRPISAFANEIQSAKETTTAVVDNQFIKQNQGRPFGPGFSGPAAAFFSIGRIWPCKSKIGSFCGGGGLAVGTPIAKGGVITSTLVGDKHGGRWGMHALKV